MTRNSMAFPSRSNAKVPFGVGLEIQGAVLTDRPPCYPFLPPAILTIRLLDMPLINVLLSRPAFLG
jgi:hypothetical protein